MNDKKVLYLYIGVYTTAILNKELDQLNDELRLIKKIGHTNDLKTRQKELSRRKNTEDYLSFEYIRAWKIPNVKIEGALHKFLVKEKVKNTEWCIDVDDSLVDRLDGYMEKMGYKICDLKRKDIKIDTDEDRRKELRDNVNLVVDQIFTAKKGGVSFTVKILMGNKGKVIYYSEYLKKEFDTFHSACYKSILEYNKKNEIKIPDSLNPWMHTKNEDGDTPYEEIGMKMKKVKRTKKSK